MIHIYTGDGKGKTTAALGLALRAVGAGKKVVLVQFLKASDYSSEIKAIKEYLPNFTVESFGRTGFGYDTDDIKKALDYALQVIRGDDHIEYDVLILDEINVAVGLDMLDAKEAEVIIRMVPAEKELILTGRDAPQRLIDIADLVTRMEEVKHYFHQGVKARKGIEY